MNVSSGKSAKDVAEAKKGFGGGGGGGGGAAGSSRTKRNNGNCPEEQVAELAALGCEIAYTIGIKKSTQQTRGGEKKEETSSLREGARGRKRKARSAGE